MPLPLAVFRLPAPVEAMSLANDLVERVYGTGAMLSMDGEFFTIREPAGGLGPRKRGKLPRHDETGSALHYAKADDGTLEMTYEEAKDICAGVGQAFAEWFEQGRGINYVTAKFIDPAGDPLGHHLTVQRAGGKSPHDNYLEALARVEALEAQLRENGIEPTDRA